MYSTFLVRLAVVLPLMLAAIVATLVLLKHGRARLQGLQQGMASDATGPIAALLQRLRRGLSRHVPLAPAGDAAPLRILARTALTPAATLAVVRFAGATHLVGVTATGISILATEPAAPSDAAIRPATPMRDAA